MHYFNFAFFERQKVLLEGGSSSNNVPRRRRSQEYEIAKLWFRQFTRFADSMPNSDVKCLPSCLTKLSVYNIYIEQVKFQKRLSHTQFIYEMWKKNFPNVHIPKVTDF
jgi:hypothetical protein